MELIEKKDEGVVMKEGMFYTLDNIKEHIPFLDDVSYRLLYLRFNENFLTEEEKKAEELMIQRLRTNKHNADKAILEEFEKNEANQPLEKVEPNDDDN